MKINLDITRASKPYAIHNNLGKQNLRQNESSNYTSTPLVQSNGAYGKAIAFGSKRFISAGNFEKAKTNLVYFFENESKPFITETKTFWDKNQQLYDRADAMTTLFHKHVISGQNKFNLLDSAIPQGYKKIAEYFKNKEEYIYLKEKSQKAFAGDAASQYASEIASRFEPVPFLEQYRPVLTHIKKTEQSIKNGFAGLKAKEKNNSITTQRDQVSKAEDLSLFNLHFISDVSIFNSNVEKVLDKSMENDAYSASKIIYYNATIPDIKNDIAKHNELLPKLEQRFEQAESLLKENSFTEEDLQKATNAVELKKQGIINRNINQFYKTLERHPQYKWDEKLNAPTDEILQKQSEANKKLFELIESGKKEYFSPEAAAIREATDKAEYFEWQHNKEYHYPLEDSSDLAF